VVQLVPPLSLPVIYQMALLIGGAITVNRSHKVVSGRKSAGQGWKKTIR
jgi:hypothetical protein